MWKNVFFHDLQINFILKINLGPILASKCDGFDFLMPIWGPIWGLRAPGFKLGVIFWFFLLKEPIIEQKMQDQGPQIWQISSSISHFSQEQKINVVAILVQILHFPKYVQVKIV